MKRMGSAFAVAALGLAGCVGQSDSRSADAPRGEPLEGECDAAPAQSMIGQQATAEAGQRLMAFTGARELRWAPPDSALTMDFRPDRLTVSYDRSLRIERITCG